MSNGPSSAAAPESFWSRTHVLIGVAAGILTILGSALTAALFFNPIPDRDLTIWIQQEVPVTLPPGTPLTMTYDNAPVRRATLLQVRLTNFGPKPIGETGAWQLTLKSNGATRVVLVSPPQLSPPNLAFRPLPSEPSKSDSLSLELGLFRTGDVADLRLLIVDPTSIAHPQLALEATRAVNIPTPRLTRESPEVQVRLHYENPLVLVFWVVFATVLLVWAIRWGTFKAAKDYVFLPFTMILMAGIVAAGLAKLLSWGLVWLVLFRVHHPAA